MGTGLIPHQPPHTFHKIFTKKELQITLSFLSLFFLLLTIILFSHQPTSTLFFSLGFLFRFRPPSSDPPLIITSVNCDFSKGTWVWDESYPIQFYNEDCPFLDPGFKCRKNGRLDEAYRNWRWQPENCRLPRFNASDFLDRSRNGRIVFAGDSIGRNQWESFLCMLSSGVSNKSSSSIYEEHGKPISRHRGFLSFRFREYNLTVQYYRLPFLVTIDKPPYGSPKIVRGAIRVDKLHWFFERWDGADVLVFNGGHWWNSEKTTKMGLYFQEGKQMNMTMDVKEAFSRSLKTWRSWVLSHLNAKNVFFRNFAPVHYRNGTWNEGGNCDDNKEPETEQKNMQSEPWSNHLISQVLDGMNSAQLLNITYLSELRKDGHPSKYREPGTLADAPQDCSHWCLPGVPDTWNELLYAHLLAKDFRTKISR